jgi:hypothetical protein
MNALFQVHILNDKGIGKAQLIAKSFDSLLIELEALIGGPGSRELSLVRTHLELAGFYAKKAMAERELNQVHQEKDEQ